MTTNRDGVALGDEENVLDLDSGDDFVNMLNDFVNMLKPELYTLKGGLNVCNLQLSKTIK